MSIRLSSSAFFLLRDKLSSSSKPSKRPARPSSLERMRRGDSAQRERKSSSGQQPQQPRQQVEHARAGNIHTAVAAPVCVSPFSFFSDSSARARVCVALNAAVAVAVADAAGDVNADNVAATVDGEATGDSTTRCLAVALALALALVGVRRPAMGAGSQPQASTSRQGERPTPPRCTRSLARSLARCVQVCEGDGIGEASLT